METEDVCCHDNRDGWVEAHLKEAFKDLKQTKPHEASCVLTIVQPILALC